MENKLNITKEDFGTEQKIILEGRLDANWAGHLDDYLINLVREGSYNFIVDMREVNYLSSAGIRILVSQYKKIKQLGGLFVLEALSPAVSEVLNMVGMLKILTEGTPAQIPVEKEQSRSLEINGYRFSKKIVSDKPMKLSSEGNPGAVMESGFTSDSNVKIRFTADKFALGLGAIGDGFDDCKKRYGEFLALGDALVYKPADGSRLPDYALKSGRMEPEINALYMLQARGAFANRITFEPLELNASVTLTGLITGLIQIGGPGDFVFLIIAESEGLVGVSLSTPPVEGRKLFEFPGLRENVNFTTEPAYPRMLTTSLGFYIHDPSDELKMFLKPAGQDSSGFMHTHTAIFPYQALPRNEAAPGELIMHLFESSIVQDVMHLINDTRDISGTGESSFRQGIVWTAKLG